MKTEDSKILSGLKRLFNLDYVIVSVIILLICYALSFVTYNVGALNPLKRVFEDFSMTDIYYHILHGRGAVELSDDIVIVDMTKQTQRGELANTISLIGDCHPKVTVLDIIFEYQTSDTKMDSFLVEAVNSLKTKVLASKLVNYNPNTQEFRQMRTSFFMDKDKYDWGYGNTTAGDQSNYIREYTTWQKCNGELVYSMPYLAACLYQGVKPKKEEVNFTQIMYNDKDFLVIPCDSVVENAKFIKDRIVYLGAMHEEADMHFSPIGKLAGVKIQAYATQTLLSHKSIRQMGTLASIIFTFFLCYFSALIVDYIRKRSTKADTALSERYPNMFPKDLQLERVKRIVSCYYLLLPIVLMFVSFLVFVFFGYNIQLLLPLAGIALTEMVKLTYKCFKPVFLNIKHWEIWKKLFKNKSEKA